MSGPNIYNTIYKKLLSEKFQNFDGPTADFAARTAQVQVIENSLKCTNSTCSYILKVSPVPDLNLDSFDFKITINNLNTITSIQTIN